MTPVETLTPEQVAEALAVHPETVRRCIRAGAVPNVGAGRHLRVPRAWLEDRLRSTPTGPGLVALCSDGWTSAADRTPAAEPVLALTTDGRLLIATFRRGRWSAADGKRELVGEVRWWRPFDDPLTEHPR